MSTLREKLDPAAFRWLGLSAFVSALLLPLMWALSYTQKWTLVLVLLVLQGTLAWAGGLGSLLLAFLVPTGKRFRYVILFIAFIPLGAIAPFGFAMLALMTVASGGAWGRPLRIRGKQLHPELRQGSDWTKGARPNVSALTPATRRALEALWLHDAQKEHASVPAFARIAWMLAAVGAPADLMERAHVAGLEEIDHARRCFALAAGYGGRSHTVEPMPELLLGGLEFDGPPLVALALESLKDGCLLEDYNADVAGRCAKECTDTAAKDLLQRIAVEERSHADFSWDLLIWCLERGGATVQRAVIKELSRLDDIHRPTAASADKTVLVASADPAQLLAHGRIPDKIWAELWFFRLTETRSRAKGLLLDKAI
ncbi:MAG: hypothetical protein ACJATT_005426 [Myxococcota bacterium]|jgi:hypothetical protein